MDKSKKIALIIATISVLVLTGLLLALMLGSGNDEMEDPKNTTSQTEDTLNGELVTIPDESQTEESTAQGGNSQGGSSQGGSSQGGSAGNNKDDDFEVEIDTGEDDPTESTTGTTNPGGTTDPADPSKPNPPQSGGVIDFNDLLEAAGKA